MDTTTVLGIAVGVLTLVVAVLCVLVWRLSGGIRAVAAARPAFPDAPPDPPQRPGTQVAPQPLDESPPASHVITRLGEPDEPARVVPNQVVLSATLGEPLVRAIALGHGVRRALGAEARNRIRFEMRREVKRARKGRRREMRVAWRQMRAQQAVPQESVQQRREDVA